MSNHLVFLKICGGHIDETSVSTMNYARQHRAWVGGGRSEVGGRTSEVGGQVGGRRLEVGGRRSEVGGCRKYPGGDMFILMSAFGPINK